MIDTALHFSGGKDSIACLHLYQEEWDEIAVLWVNTGAQHPDMIDFMRGWKERLPHFIEINTDQPGNLRTFGWPVDVLPIENTLFGKEITGNKGPLLQSSYDCCARNVWFPLHQATLALGVKHVIKGQRANDRRKSTAHDGSVIDGVTYHMPLEDWSEDEVFSYLKKVGAELPEGYARGERTGRDCWDCTAFLDENRERIANLPFVMRSEVERRLALISRAVNDQMEDMTNAVAV
jgi:phosphoadenosine phosphosulfate reductase